MLIPSHHFREGFAGGKKTPSFPVHGGFKELAGDGRREGRGGDSFDLKEGKRMFLLT